MTSKHRRWKIGCAAIIVLPAMIAVVVALNWLREPFGPAYIIQSRKPLALAEAKEISGLPLPNSAKNIRFAHFSQWIGHETFVRFEAPEADCLAFAEKIIADSESYHNKSKPVAVRFSKLVEPIGAGVASSSTLDTSWFDLPAIRHGVDSNGGPGHRPKVWIDTDRGVCYYMLTD